jgi:hypothetical protein
MQQFKWRETERLLEISSGTIWTLSSPSGRLDRPGPVDCRERSEAEGFNDQIDNEPAGREPKVIRDHSAANPGIEIEEYG